MICVELKASAADDENGTGDCSWAIIIAAIRCQAARQPEESAADLNGWADLLEGLTALNPPD